jgi:hypothetical protein
VFIDDASEDETGKEVMELLKFKYFNMEKIEFVFNKERKKAMANLRMAAFNYCKP